MISRRSFLKLAGATTLGLMMPTRLGGVMRLFALPNPTLDPLTVTKYAAPMIIPPAMPSMGKIKVKGGQNIDYYEIAVEQFPQQVLPVGNPMTTVWSYGVPGKPATFNFPAFTIEADWKRPVRVKWINNLKDANGNYLPHLLPVDQTLHWANPPGGPMGRDMRPTFTTTPDPYTGPVPMVTHVHGAVDIGDESDGYTEAWYLPAANDIPAGHATEGTWYNTFAGQFAAERATGHPSDTWGLGYATFQYPNTQRASTLWYHDHTLGMTRLNVYAGPAGFYIIRGGPDGDKAVLDSATGLPAVLPGPYPKLGDKGNKTYYEIPIAIQDRSFNDDGSLFYPDSRFFFDNIGGPYIPDSDIAPIWNPEFFGDVMVVNGQSWPFQTVEQRRYRFRLLNGCNSRFLILDFSGIPGVEVWQIGNEGGFLAAPVNHTALGNTLLMAPAERADVIVDFTNVPVGNYILGNIGPDEPFGGGVPGVDFPVAKPATTGQVMQFQVVPALAPDPTTPPANLILPTIVPLPVPLPADVRPLALNEVMSMYPGFDGPAEALLGRVDADGSPIVVHGMHAGDMWMDPITENPAVGAVEDWVFYNFTADAHPMHVHEVTFELVERQPLATDADGATVAPATPVGLPLPPEPWEMGRKDTVIAYPGQATRVRAQFNTPGLFVWHCHIVEHEDNEMMRPFAVGTPPMPM